MKINNSFLKLSINLKAVQDNYRKIEAFTNTKVAAVVKADGYGLGAIPVSKALEDAGCTRFYVATVAEAFELRTALKKTSQIFLFNGFHNSEFQDLKEHNVIPILTRLDQIHTYGPQLDTVVLNFDTGLSRLSIPDHDLNTVIEATKQIPVTKLMSHLACADDATHPLNEAQKERFIKITEAFPKAERSLSASKGLNLGPAYFLDEVRIGIYLYGISPSEETAFSRTLTPAVRVQSQILNVQTLKKGDTVGYGATFTAPHAMNVATIAGGYADHTPLGLSNKGCVFMDDYSLPIIGKVSMDLTTIDVSKLSDRQAKVGNWVDLIPDPMTFYKQSVIGGSSPHEMLTRLGHRFNRSYDIR